MPLKWRLLGRRSRLKAKVGVLRVVEVAWESEQDFKQEAFAVAVAFLSLLLFLMLLAKSLTLLLSVFSPYLVTLSTEAISARYPTSLSVSDTLAALSSKLPALASPPPVLPQLQSKPSQPAPVAVSTSLPPSSCTPHKPCSLQQHLQRQETRLLSWPPQMQLRPDLSEILRSLLTKLSLKEVCSPFLPRALGLHRGFRTAWLSGSSLRTGQAGLSLTSGTIRKECRN